MSWIKIILKKVDTSSKSPKKQHQFGYLLIVILLILCIISVYKKGIIFNAAQIVIISLIICASILVFCYRKVFTPLLFLWLLFGEFMGRFTNYIVLSVVYYLVFSPIALILNTFNRKKQYPSSWIDRENTIDYDSLS